MENDNEVDVLEKADENGYKKFRRYCHLEHFGGENTDGIIYGKVHVFPKLDGTNASVWKDNEGVIQCGSRNRILSSSSDNAGFYAWVNSKLVTAVALRNVVTSHPSWVIYGEWLIPHTLTTYRENAWKRFWIFDIFDRNTGLYVAYEDYVEELKAAGLDVIEPLCTIQNPSEEQLRTQVSVNTYLIADGAGLGEGVVIKNYSWYQGFLEGQKGVWAKIVRNEFKEENQRAFGVTEKNGEFQIEIAISEEFVTPHLVGKCRAKILLALANENNVSLEDKNWQSIVTKTYRAKLIPQLLHMVWHDLIQEEMWSILQKHRNAEIHFGKLQNRVFAIVKQYSQDLF